MTTDRERTAQPLDSTANGGDNNQEIHPNLHLEHLKLLPVSCVSD